MKIYLLQGLESPERFNLLLSLTSVRSEPVIAALIDYYVNGFRESECLTLNEVARGKFNRATEVLNKVAKIVDDIKVHDEKVGRKKARKPRINKLSHPDIILP